MRCLSYICKIYAGVHRKVDGGGEGKPVLFLKTVKSLHFLSEIMMKEKRVNKEAEKPFLMYPKAFFPR